MFVWRVPTYLQGDHLKSHHGCKKPIRPVLCVMKNASPPQNDDSVMIKMNIGRLHLKNRLCFIISFVSHDFDLHFHIEIILQAMTSFQCKEIIVAECFVSRKTNLDSVNPGHVTNQLIWANYTLLWSLWSFGFYF